tara:strand:- start:2501 stop:3346 length:846 start_codon:yes stop_codon:yes gene_type:complete
MDKRVKTIGILFSKMRKEEKMLLSDSLKNNFNIEHIDTRKIITGKDHFSNIDVILDREVSHSQSLYALNYFESIGKKTINSFKIANICGDKVYTSLLLDKHKIPNLKTFVAFSSEAAKDTILSLGFPCVIKPPVGSWGRLIAKINDFESAEAILEHKSFIPSNNHSIFYIQEYVKKPGRDIRAFAIDGNTICAIYRNSEHWITNTSRGGKATNCPINNEIHDLCSQISKAIGQGLLAVDLIETSSGMKVVEVNHKMEFRNSIDITGVNIPQLMLEYALKET